MSDEIERKFLISALPDAAAQSAATRIEQGYLAIGEGTEIRLRRAGGRMTLGAKRGQGESRSEHEIALYKEQFDELWELSEDRRLLKTRRRVPLANDGLVAEVDVYEGSLAGLAVVEVEFESSAQSKAFEPPPWFGRELTGDSAYSNQSLASQGLPRHDSGEDGNRRGMSKAYRLKRKEGAAEGLERIVRGRLEKAGERLRDAEQGDRAAAIHGSRKDLKKVRAVLRLLREELGRKRFKAENARYRDAGRMLSASRDAEVKLETLGELEACAGDDFPAGPSLVWQEALEADREQLAADGEGDLDEQIERAAAAIAAAAETVSSWPIGSDSWPLLEPGLGRSYREGRKALKRARAEGGAEDVHEFRKRAKDLWYQLRLLRDAWPGVLEPTADEAHELTDLLGDHHDLAVLSEDLDSRAGLVAAREEFQALIASRQAQLLDAALELGERLYAEKPKHFLRRLRGYWRAWRG